MRAIYEVFMEIEIKLALSELAVMSFRKKIAQINVINNDKFQLINRYFDTNNNYFAQHKMGLRVREKNGDYTMTLKTAGKESNGLHARPEYNISITTAIPDLTKFIEIDSQNSELTKIDWEQLNKNIQPLFNTNFTREIWIVSLKSGTKFEIALDQGYVLSETQQEVIQELEFELITGSVSEMLKFIMHECCIDGAYLANDSKAKRGYRLAGFITDNSVQELEICEDKLQELLINHEYNFSEILTIALFLEERLSSFIYSHCEKNILPQQYPLYTKKVINLFLALFNYYKNDRFIKLLQAQSRVASELNNFITAVSSLSDFLNKIEQNLDESSEISDVLLKLKERFSLSDNLLRGLILLSITIEE